MAHGPRRSRHCRLCLLPARRVPPAVHRGGPPHGGNSDRAVLHPLETGTGKIIMTILALALVALTLQNADTIPPAVAMESPYEVHSGALELGGTLTLPRGTTGPVPVVVIIAGSGPTDRNGNSLMGIRPNSYAQLAWRLAERGIASLRYDKRGLPGTKGTFDMTTMTLDDFAADARAAAESLAHDVRFSRVILLGHSEGSSLALLAARAGPPVAAVISVSGLGRPFGVVL